MGLFSRSNPFDEDIEYATSESNLSDNWALFLSVCDKIDNTNGEADACSSLIKRLTHSNQRISCQAVSLLNAAVINCSKFKEYVCTHKPAMDAIEIVARRNYRDKSGISMREMMAKWCFEFKTSSEMNNMRALYYKLKGEGFTFPDVEADMARQEQKKQALKDQENALDDAEAADLAKALALSEEQAKKSKASESPVKQVQQSPYADVNQLLKRQDELHYQSISDKKSKKNYAKALYDFEAAEENEITFAAGDIIVLLDTGHEAWWSGKNLSNDRTGLFPVNFVEKLDYDPIDTANPQTNQVNGAPMVGNSAAAAAEAGDNNQTTASTEYQRIVVPLDMDRAGKTLEKLKNHDPEEQEDLTLQFNEILCNHMESEVNRRVQELDDKYDEINQINEKLKTLMEMIDMNQLTAGGMGINMANQNPFGHQMGMIPPNNMGMMGQNNMGMYQQPGNQTGNYGMYQNQMQMPNGQMNQIQMPNGQMMNGQMVNGQMQAGNNQMGSQMANQMPGNAQNSVTNPTEANSNENNISDDKSITSAANLNAQLQQQNYQQTVPQPNQQPQMTYGQNMVFGQNQMQNNQMQPAMQNSMVSNQPVGSQAMPNQAMANQQQMAGQMPNQMNNPQMMSNPAYQNQQMMPQQNMMMGNYMQQMPNMMQYQNPQNPGQNK